MSDAQETSQYARSITLFSDEDHELLNIVNTNGRLSACRNKTIWVFQQSVQTVSELIDLNDLFFTRSISSRLSRATLLLIRQTE